MASKKDMETFNMFQYLVIYKLYKLKCIGKRHTNKDNIPKGYPPADRKYIKDALEILIKRGIVLSKPTSYGLEVSLNPRYPELQNIISEAENKFKEYQQAKKRQRGRGHS